MCKVGQGSIDGPSLSISTAPIFLNGSGYVRANTQFISGNECIGTCYQCRSDEKKGHDQRGAQQESLRMGDASACIRRVRDCSTNKMNVENSCLKTAHSQSELRKNEAGYSKHNPKTFALKRYVRSVVIALGYRCKPVR